MKFMIQSAAGNNLRSISVPTEEDAELQLQSGEVAVPWDDATMPVPGSENLIEPGS